VTTDQKVAGSTPAGRTNIHGGFVSVALPEAYGSRGICDRAETEPRTSHS